MRAFAWSFPALLLAFPALVPSVRAQQPDGFFAYEPHTIPAGVIRSWGHVFLQKIMLNWEAAFVKYHPGIMFSDNLVSSAAGTGALFTDTADLGIVGREIRPLEVAGYNRVKKHKPFPLEVMTGSFSNADKSVALGIFVQKDNPITHLTFKQLDSIFGAEHLAGSPCNIRTWGQLGLTGEWAIRPIEVYTGELDAAPGFFFLQTVMKGSVLWNERLQHFDDLERSDKTVYLAQQRVVDAVAVNAGAIGLSGAGVLNPNVKLVPISATDAGPFLAPTPANDEARSYPLSRAVWIYTNQAPGHPIDPRTAEFLRFIFSREGQQLVREEGEYLPLTPANAAAQLRKLNQ